MSSHNPALSDLLNPVPKHPTVIETLVRQILSLIRVAGLKPGDRLPSEKEIIETTNASRPSVREALRVLKTMGIVETRPGSGSFIKHFDPADVLQPELIRLGLLNEDFVDIVQARIAIECETARALALEGCRDVPTARAACDKMSVLAAAGQEIYAVSWEFHLALAEQAGNPVIVRLLHILYELIREAQLRVYWPKTDLVDEARAHRALYEAVVSGNPERAAGTMRDHLQRMVQVVQGSDDDPGLEQKTRG